MFGQQEKTHCVHTTNQTNAAELRSSRPRFNSLSFKRDVNNLECPQQYPICMSAALGLGGFLLPEKRPCKYTFCVPLSSGLLLWTESIAQTSRGKIGSAWAVAGSSYSICA